VCAAKLRPSWCSTSDVSTCSAADGSTLLLLTSPVRAPHRRLTSGNPPSLKHELVCTLTQVLARHGYASLAQLLGPQPADASDSQKTGWAERQAWAVSWVGAAVAVLNGTKVGGAGVCDCVVCAGVLACCLCVVVVVVVGALGSHH
jgi:hypothetical protein